MTAPEGSTNLCLGIGGITPAACSDFREVLVAFASTVIGAEPLERNDRSPFEVCRLSKSSGGGEGAAPRSTILTSASSVDATSTALSEFSTLR